MSEAKIIGNTVAIAVHRQNLTAQLFRAWDSMSANLPSKNWRKVGFGHRQMVHFSVCIRRQNKSLTWLSRFHTLSSGKRT